jgi:hypothetical protein
MTTKKTSTQLDAEIAEALASSPTFSSRSRAATQPPPPLKRRMYDINPSSPEVIQAFLKSGYAADEVGIQEFIAKHYAGWMRQYSKRHEHEKRDDPRSTARASYATDPSDIWAGIIVEFTEALRKHGVHVED